MNNLLLITGHVLPLEALWADETDAAGADGSGAERSGAGSLPGAVPPLAPILQLTIKQFSSRFMFYLMNFLLVVDAFTCKYFLETVTVL